MGDSVNGVHVKPHYIRLGVLALLVSLFCGRPSQFWKHQQLTTATVGHVSVHQVTH